MEMYRKANINLIKNHIMLKVYKTDDKQFPFTIEFNPDRKQQLTEKAVVELIGLLENEIKSKDKIDDFMNENGFGLNQP